MKYGELNLGQMEAIVNKLGGMEGVRQFLSGELVVEKGKGEVIEVERKFQVWKTIKIGGFKRVYDLRTAIEEHGMRVLCDEDILWKIPVATTEVEIDLVVVTTATLIEALKGKIQESTTKEIYKSATRLGLEKCPPEVGLQLRLQYQEQLDERLLIGMNPVKNVFGFRRIFEVVSFPDYKPSFDAYRDFDHLSSADDKWVFVLPRK